MEEKHVFTPIIGDAKIQIVITAKDYNEAVSILADQIDNYEDFYIDFELTDNVSLKQSQ